MERIIIIDNGKVLILTLGMKLGIVRFLTLIIKTEGSLPVFQPSTVAANLTWKTWFTNSCTSSGISSSCIIGECSFSSFRPRTLHRQGPRAERRYYSTNVSETKKNIVPEVTYENADTQRLVILKDNRKRAGVYRWVNKLSGKSYVGSSVDLARRLKYYYNLSFLEKINKVNSRIYRSLLKNGYSNFKLEILEYCDTLNIVIQREQYYIDLIKPEYNILALAGSLRGFKHSERTRKLLSELNIKNKTWENNLEGLGECGKSLHGRNA
jgi:hypothetical protein